MRRPTNDHERFSHLVRVMGWICLLSLTACAQNATPPTVSPALSPSVPAATHTLTLTYTVSAAPTPTPTPTATSTPTPDATWVAEATLEAIRYAVATEGVLEGSREFDARVEGLRCVLIPPPTPTVLPIRLQPAGEVQRSASCLGADLPGLNERVWIDGQWVEAERYLFVHAADLFAAQQAYERYLRFISFGTTGPTEAIAADLAELGQSTEALPSPESCQLSQVASLIASATQRGVFVRLTLTQGLSWEPRYSVLLGDDLLVVLHWQARGVRQELVNAIDGQVLKQAIAPVLAGSPRLTYHPASAQWRLADDAGGYYCGAASFFLP